jgi:hypothetical protein
MSNEPKEFTIKLTGKFFLIAWVVFLVVLYMAANVIGATPLILAVAFTFFLPWVYGKARAMDETLTLGSMIRAFASLWFMWVPLTLIILYIGSTTP